MEQLLAELSQRGIKIVAKGELLSIQAPQGALTKELKDALAAHKSQLLALLQQPNRPTNLEAELFLESTICPGAHPIVRSPSVTSIFLTGATGFLGAFILQELLQNSAATIYCLVRAGSENEAQQKIKRNLMLYQLWEDQFESRIIGIQGDLSKPRLGLTESKFDDLAQEIDTIYHSGALLNWVYSYAALKPINVLGTHEILRLACHHHVKPVHYISTLAVLGAAAYAGQNISETEPLAAWMGMELGYAQSKWVAEKLILKARDRGLPVTIYRPPLISGHSQTGAWNTEDVVCRVIKGCIQMGSIADLDYLLDLSPVDYVARAIVALSMQPESIHQVFHLNNPHPLPWHDFVAWLQNFGYPIRLHSYEDWLECLSGIAPLQKNPLSPLLSFWRKRSLQGDLLIPTRYNRQTMPEVNCQNTLAVLLPHQIICPPVNSELLNRYFQYFTDNHFLDIPAIDSSIKDDVTNKVNMRSVGTQHPHPSYSLCLPK